MSETPAAKTNPEKLSKAPSWMLIGFIAGILVAHSGIRYYDTNWAVKPTPPPEPARPPTPEEKAERAARNRPDLWLVEALFEQRAPEAIWQDNLTEVILWNAATNDFKDGVEVLRRGEKFYYRSIDKLTRLPIQPAPNSAIALTEPEAVRLIREGKAEVQVIKVPDLRPPGHEKHAELPPVETNRIPVPSITPPNVPAPATDPKLP